jgi:hypothetical protein
MTETRPPTWSAIYEDTSAPSAQAMDSVPGESTLADEGAFAFRRDTIRGLVFVTDGALDLRRWLAVVPDVHRTFATSGAEKTVAMLQTTDLGPDDALLDAFAREMADWARSNDPALELSVVAIP